MSSQKGFAPILIIIFIAVATLGGGYFVYQTQVSKPTPKPSPVACTLEAKLCPDGTSVGRTGPKCEFAPCPTPKVSTSSADISNWKTYTNKKYKYTMKYPQDWEFDVGYREEQKIARLVLFQGPKNCASALRCGRIDVEVKQLEKSEQLLSPELYWKKQHLTITPPVFQLVEGKNIQFGGIQAYEVISANIGTDRQGNSLIHKPSVKSITIINNQHVYTISVSETSYLEYKQKKNNALPQSVSVSEWSLSDTFDQILSTFKFLD